MRNKKVRFAPVRSEPVIMDGGLNENISNIELRGGELISCLNYELVDGSQGGYRSIKGYERYDGSTKPSSVPATDADHVAQDAARAAIDAVPGTGAVLGVWIFEGKVYAFRNKTATPVVAAGMYVESGTGWTEVSTAGDPLSPGGSYNFVNYNFTGTPADFSMYWTNGVNECRAFNGTTVTTITTGMGANDKPINITAHNDRLWLAFTGGSLQYSTVGDPADWTTSPGEFGLGREITNLVGSVGNSLVVFCDSAIRIVNGYSNDDFVVENYTNYSGAYLKTAARLFGSIMFLDDTGVTSLEATQEYGNLKANSISQKVYNTLQSNKLNASCAVVSSDLSQYRLFFNNSYGLYFSFLDKKMRGITLVKFDVPVLSVATGEDATGNVVTFFTSSDGYVYQMDSGTSFDGEEIDTTLKTSFYHYKSPRFWKRFKELVFEIASVDDISLMLKLYFDYASGYVPGSVVELLDIVGIGEQWGVDDWGVIVYSGSDVTNRVKYPIHGVGSNMSVSIRSSEAYKHQHTIQNFITDFQLAGRQL